MITDEKERIRILTGNIDNIVQRLDQKHISFISWVFNKFKMYIGYTNVSLTFLL